LKFIDWYTTANSLNSVSLLRVRARRDEGADTVETNERLGLALDLREYGKCAEILFDMGLCKVRVLSNNPLRLQALKDAGFEGIN
jgi:GTP cyclohydrolase II